MLEPLGSYANYIIVMNALQRHSAIAKTPGRGRFVRPVPGMLLSSRKDAMKAIKSLLNSMERFFHRLETRRIEAYLSEAQNVQDLERRMRLLDKHSYFDLP